MSLKKIILTGFMPFGDYKANPVQKSTEYFNHRLIGPYNRRKIIGLVLPCTYYGAFRMLSEVIDTERPTAIVSTGLSSGVRGVRIETRFRNIMNGKYPDSDGYKPVNVPIKPVAKDFYDATADPVLLGDALRLRDIPIEISDDADSFVCNSLGYLTTRKIVNEGLHIKNTFIHIPWTDEYRDTVALPPEKMYLEKEKFYEALEMVLKII